METQQEFVEQALAYNRENGFVSVNGTGAHEDAHYPRPKGTGEETVPLTHGQHQVQGLLQSEEEGRCCFFSGDTKAFLYGDGFLCPYWFELVDLYEKWAADNGLRSISLMETAGKLVGFRDPNTQKKALNKVVDERLGFLARTPEEVRKHNSRAGCIGGVANVKRRREEGVPLFINCTPKDLSQYGRAGGSNNVKRRQEKGLPYFMNLTPEKHSEAGKRGGRTTGDQKWLSLVTGLISTGSGIVRHHRRIGRDPNEKLLLTREQFETLNGLPPESRLIAVQGDANATFGSSTP